MENVKQQHYVPRVYLRRFATHGERLYVYDKIKNEIRGPEKITHVATERYFYDVPIDVDRNERDVYANPQLEEKALSQLEGEINSAIDAALRVVEGKGADLEERRTMATLVAMQFLRTRAYRKQIVDLATGGEEQLLDTVLRLVAPHVADKYRAEVHYDKGAAATLHARCMWDLDTLTTLVAGIYHHLWIIGVNSTGIPLYTSDNPVVLRSHIVEGTTTETSCDGPGLTLATLEFKSMFPGPLSRGVEMILPLTPNCALIMLDREHFSYLEPNQGRACNLDLGQVQAFNVLQVQQSERQVFSISDDFEIARCIAELNAGTKEGTQRYSVDVKIHNNLKILDVPDA